MSDLLDDVVAAAGLTVFGAAATTRPAGAPAPFPFLPGPELTARIAAIRAPGLDRVLLIGPGAGAAAIAATLGLDLTVLDTADPHRARSALADRLDRTVVVLAAPAPTVVVDALRRVVLQAFEDAGRHDPGRRFVVVTAPGSGYETFAHELGAPLFLAPPTASALSAYALVPAGLAGADVAALLDEAAAFQAPPPPRPPAGFAAPAPRTGFAGPAAPAPASLPPGGAPASPLLGNAPGSLPPGAAPGSPPRGAAPASPLPEDAPASPLPQDAPASPLPGVALGETIAAAVRAGRDKLAVAPDGTGIDGLGPWIERLFGDALVTVALENPSSWGHEGPDVLGVTVGGVLGRAAMPGGGISPDLSVNGPLGAQLLAWEQAAILTAAATATNAGARAATGDDDLLRRLDEPRTPVPAFVEGAIEVYGPAAAPTLIEAVDALARSVAPGGRVAVEAHLDPAGDAAAAGVRDALAGRVARAVTFGWGPRTAPGSGATLLITGAVTHDVPVPGRPYTLGELQAASAAPGDGPWLRLHLTDRATGMEQLLAALGG